MFEDAKREVESYQLDMLHEYVAMVAPPSTSDYESYAQCVSAGGRDVNSGRVRSVGRIGAGSFGPDDMDVSMIVDLLVGGNDGGRRLLGIGKPGPKVRQELFNIRNDRNDLQAHRGKDSSLSSLGSSYVMAEHLMRFLLALSDDGPHCVSAEQVTDYLDKWFVTLRHFLDGLEVALTEYGEMRKPERWANEMMDRVLSRTGEEREQEHNTCWLELHKRGTRVDDYGHPRSEKEQEMAMKAIALFDKMAAEAGITRAQETVRHAALCLSGDNPWFRYSDYAERAVVLLRCSRTIGLNLTEKLCLAGLLKNGLLPTHALEEGNRLLKECESELEEGESIAAYETDEGFTFYRMARSLP